MYDLTELQQIQYVTVKPACNDPRKGMKTLPLIYALQDQPQNGLSQQVQPLLNGAAHTEEEILALVARITQGNGISLAQADAQTYAQKAREALYYFPSSKNRDVLDELIDFVVKREN